MPESRSVSEVPFQLFQLPKERQVLDFILQKLGESSSPERYELLEALLNMYRTSTGFDPYALSKARFKRLKAAEFRQTLMEIDVEIGLLIQSPEYKQYISKKSDYAVLFQSFLELAEAVRLHPSLSLQDELEAFENTCIQQEAPELLLAFYRQHTTFIEDLYRKDGEETFLERYKVLAERLRQLQAQFRLHFELLLLEKASEKGMVPAEKTIAFLQEAGHLLTLEKNNRFRFPLLMHIIRAAALTNPAFGQMAPYLDYLEASEEKIRIYLPEAKGILLTTLARYHIQAGREQRLRWLEEAENDARQQELHDERPGLRFIACIIEADSGNIQEALRILNEAEHLIYKASTRSLAARNNWVKLSEFKTLLLVLQILRGEDIPYEQLALLQQLAEDMGRHRHEISIMTLEWKGLQHFLNRDPESALTCFEKAKGYRKNQQDHPWLILDKFFCQLLQKSRKKEEVASGALLLAEMKEPFYSAIGGAIMKEAAAMYIAPSRIK